MSHELTMNGNKAEMAFTGETPWHGLGQQVTKGASIEEWQAAAGMDWRINRSRVRYGADDAPRIIEDKHVLFRSDNKEPLGIVSDNFKIVQPSHVLEFFRDLTQAQGFNIETAGTLKGGKRLWALASIGDACDIVPGDRVGGFLLLCTGTDGTLATTARYTTIRVVCNNTLSAAVAGDAAQHRTTHRSVFDPAKAKAELGIAHEQFETFAQTMKRLADKTVSKERATLLAFELMKPANYDALDSQKKMEAMEAVSDSKGMRTILALFGGHGKGARMDGVAGTAWGFVNACSEYQDYYAPARSSENRLNSAWFGPGASFKEKAVELALAF